LTPSLIATPLQGWDIILQFAREFNGPCQVVYIMKVKCPAVARAVGSDIGTYIAHVR